MSIVADALIEMAAQHFTDITPSNSSGGRSFYRVVGGSTIRTGANFELVATKFDHEGSTFCCRTKAGKLDINEVAERMQPFPGIGSWSLEGNDKAVVGPVDQIEKIFRSGCYAFFPSNRSELPFWANTQNEEPISVFRERYADRLTKPIAVTATINDLLPWIVDVILDQSLDAVQFVLNRVKAQESLTGALQNVGVLQSLNRIVRVILGDEQARIVRTGRGALSRKIQIFSGDSHLLLPSLNSLSAGQATLLSIFSTILRYADTGQIASPAHEMQGIVLVDEIDAHLHADLQHRALPALMRLFPKIQFIASSHSPLFPLGMVEVYGDEGFSLVELPTATKITAERFSEFLDSFRYFQATKSFEEEVASRAAKAERPLVLCEGETDPRYLRTAAGLLGFDWLLDKIELDWVGQPQPGGAIDGGKDRLAQAAKLLKNNPQIVRSPMVLAFDFDAPQASADFDNIHIRTFPENVNNKVCRSGIENMLPEGVFEERFYQVIEKRTADVTRISKLRKRDLCNFICEERQNPADFEAFRPAIEILVAALGLVAPASNDQATPLSCTVEDPSLTTGVLSQN
ncbi:AAA family ATPase [Mesorhizobium sp. M0598]|uniref:AAA family ATPase n=1 Tax=unclassified Mesorhizobium TaxID=325217 RepID=UPI003338F055